MSKQKLTKENTYFVRGMHCASCELNIEKKLLSFGNIKAVDAKADKGEVVIEYTGEAPETTKLNSVFKEDGYVFSQKPFEAEKQADKNGKGDFNIVAGISLLILAIFFLLNKLGVSNVFNVSSGSSIPAFFAFGLVAGFSGCAALVGGIVLSLSKQWSSLYSPGDSTKKKLQPHLMFNIGRVISFAVLGAFLGIIGSKLQTFAKFTPFLVIAVSILMVLTALQMLGVKSMRKIQFTLPKFANRFIANEKNFRGKAMPFVMGALTFFLPCGFTITAQSLALLSGNPAQASLIMLAFALGTVPALLGIGLSAVKFSQKPHWSLRFSKIAGVVVLAFALFNVNNQMNVLGYNGLFGFATSLASQPQSSNNSNNSNSNTNNNTNTNTNTNTNVSADDGLPTIVDGKQVIKMEASAAGYKPNYFKVRVGVPVRWEITDTGTSGCTNAIISKSLFDGQIPLTPGQVSVKEFTPSKAGKYRFSCWMGMVTGTMEVVDGSAIPVVSGTVQTNDETNIIPSGAKGCGCGGGGGGSGSCGVR